MRILITSLLLLSMPLFAHVLSENKIQNRLPILELLMKIPPPFLPQQDTQSKTFSGPTELGYDSANIHKKIVAYSNFISSINEEIESLKVRQKNKEIELRSSKENLAKVMELPSMSSLKALLTDSHLTSAIDSYEKNTSKIINEMTKISEDQKDSERNMAGFFMRSEAEMANQRSFAENLEPRWIALPSYQKKYLIDCTEKYLIEFHALEAAIRDYEARVIVQIDEAKTASNSQLIPFISGQIRILELLLIKRVSVVHIGWSKFAM